MFRRPLIYSQRRSALPSIAPYTSCDWRESDPRLDVGNVACYRNNSAAYLDVLYLLSFVPIVGIESTFPAYETGVLPLDETGLCSEPGSRILQDGFGIHRDPGSPAMSETKKGRLPFECRPWKPPHGSGSRVGRSRAWWPARAYCPRAATREASGRTGRPRIRSSTSFCCRVCWSVAWS